MPKFFKNFPTNFERYNPEDNFTLLEDIETRDENDKYHSYDDKPSLVFAKSNESEVKDIYWHSHGRINRQNNKPPHVSITKNTYYATYDSNENLHSFNGNPGDIFYDPTNKEFVVTFYKNNLIHRTGGNPAQYAFNEAGQVTGENYYENDYFHRGGGLPAGFTKWSNANAKTWAVKSFAHNENGPSYVLETTTQFQNTLQWALYDIRLTEAVFNTIKFFEEEDSLPIWLAFLKGLKIIDEAQVHSVLNNNLHKDLPLEWALKSIGITNEIFDHKTSNMKKQSRHYSRGSSLKALLEITKFNEQDQGI